MARRVLVLGSTGSVGRQTLQVLERMRETHRVVGLSARSSAERLAEQAAAHRPEAVCLVDERPVAAPAGCAVLHGAEGLLALVERTRPDVVIAAITGAAGLPSTLAAAATGAVLGLANKESLVLAGHLLMPLVRASGGHVVPVDSEHSALFQCLAGARPEHVRRLVLTASGGPFRGRTRAALEDVTPDQALRHPRWAMGPRITVDSATLMNKALEVIEACALFAMPPERVEVVVHPQSVVHSLVEYVDGALLAQLGPPDMRLPIRYALGWPERVDSGEGPVDLLALSGLTFEAPDRETFPCLAHGERAARRGGLAGTILNAANEVAVDAFLDGRLRFPAIAEIVGAALDRFAPAAAPDLETILATDDEVRRYAAALTPQPAS